MKSSSPSDRRVDQILRSLGVDREEVRLEARATRLGTRADWWHVRREAIAQEGDWLPVGRQKDGVLQNVRRGRMAALREDETWLFETKASHWKNGFCLMWVRAVRKDNT